MYYNKNCFKKIDNSKKKNLKKTNIVLRYTSLLSDASSHWAFNLVDVLSDKFSTTCVGCCCTCDSDFPSSSHYTSCENVKIQWFFQKTESVKMYCCPKMKNSVHPQFSLIVSMSDEFWLLKVFHCSSGEGWFRFIVLPEASVTKTRNTAAAAAVKQLPKGCR